MDKKDIASYNLEELTQEMKTLGEKPFRARQIYAWLHQKLAGDFQEMTDLSKALRERLEAGYEIRKMEPVAHLISKKDPTEKFLFELADGNQIESVLMKYNYGNSVCISSQAGCRMGCRFCASTIGGLNRSLTTSEMLRQIYPDKTQMQLASQEGILMVVRSIAIEYKSPAFLEDEITVLTDMEDVQHFSFTMRQRIMRSDTFLSDLSVRIAVIDSVTKRPKKIPEDILKAFEA